MEGDVFAKLENPQLTEASKQIKILSRAKPDDKRKMVRALKESGEVVAVTGDGTNDAPALNSADVGISMGISGTSIAKEVAQMVLLDDSFKSIVTGVMWGRALYLNIQKFIVFQLTINVTALLVALTGPFIGIELPFTVTQMLWINLIMDTFAALALSTEPPRAEIMKNKPRSQTAFVVTKQMASEIFSTGIIFVVFLIFLLLYFKHNAIVETIKGTTESFTLWEKSIFFSIFVFLQLWNLLNARMLGLTEHAFKGLAKNKAFVLIVIVIFIGQILMVQIGGDIFRTMSLSIKEWLVIIFGTSIVLWIGELKRFMMRKIWYN
jgi:Ca2+-transporting ATPase